METSKSQWFATANRKRPQAARRYNEVYGVFISKKERIGQPVINVIVCDQKYATSTAIILL